MKFLWLVAFSVSGAGAFLASTRGPDAGDLVSEWSALPVTDEPLIRETIYGPNASVFGALRFAPSRQALLWYDAAAMWSMLEGAAGATVWGVEIDSGRVFGWLIPAAGSGFVAGVHASQVELGIASAGSGRDEILWGDVSLKWSRFASAYLLDMGTAGDSRIFVLRPGRFPVESIQGRFAGEGTLVDIVGGGGAGRTEVYATGLRLRLFGEESEWEVDALSIAASHRRECGGWRAQLVAADVLSETSVAALVLAQDLVPGGGADVQQFRKSGQESQIVVLAVVDLNDGDVQWSRDDFVPVTMLERDLRQVPIELKALEGEGRVVVRVGEAPLRIVAREGDVDEVMSPKGGPPPPVGLSWLYSDAAGRAWLARPPR
jgi:hypothetical protein